MTSRAYGNSFDQRLRKSQVPAQLRFSRRHFAIVTFMIIPCEVQYSMQNQDADLIGKRMAEPLGVSSGKIERDGNVTREAWDGGERRKGENIGGGVLASKTAI